MEGVLVEKNKTRILKRCTCMILIKVGIMLRFEMFYMMVHKKFWTFIWSHASENSFQKDDFVMLTSRAKLYPPNLAHQETLNVFCATKVMDFQIS